MIGTEIEIPQHLIKKFRRYEQGIKPFYDEVFERKLSKSNVFNPSSTPALYFINHSDSNSVKSALMGRQERLEALKEDLEQIEEERERFKQRMINIGDPNPESRTQERFDRYIQNDISEKKLRNEAVFDAVSIEISFLKSLLDGFNKQEKDNHKSLVLSQDPTGGRRRSRRHDTREICDTVDNQYIGIINETPCIDDADSPYDGMSVADYLTHVSQPWKDELKKRKKKNRELLKKWHEDGKVLSKKPELLPEPPLPEWPDNIVNHKKYEKANC